MSKFVLVNPKNGIEVNPKNGVEVIFIGAFFYFFEDHRSQMS